MSVPVSCVTYYIDDSQGPARTFDGIGGLSGGGATSVFISMYEEPYRSEVLDFLFKPDFGASLHILKIEIGADAQTTNGAEATHQRTPWEAPNFDRGYEYFLMAEAKKRNPKIVIYGLPWAWPMFVSCTPGTLTNCSGNPFTDANTTAMYIVDWVRGAYSHGVPVDIVGSWNERGYTVDYILTLRAALDAAGFSSTRIVLSDNHNVDDVTVDLQANSSFAAAVWGLAQHYPGAYSSPVVEASKKPVWASEETSTFNNGVGAGCWAREVNQNFVRGNMTSSINWNLLAAYMKGTNWWRTGLMNAFQPWSGHYGSMAMVWATAHTTQFSRPGWSYLKNGTGPGTGSGLLARGGSYVTLFDPTTGDFSIVIEKMSPDHSVCVRWHVFDFTSAAENATFELVGGPAKVSALQLWRTHYSFGAPGDSGSSYFVKMPPVDVVNGTFMLLLDVDSLYTLTTLSSGSKGSFAPPPPPAVFPRSHVDSFDGCTPPGEADYFCDQSGKWECALDQSTSGRGIVMQQKTPLKPIPSGGDVRPHSLLGSRDSVNISMSIDVRLASNGSVIVAARLVRSKDAQNDGCTDYAGIVFAVDTAGAWNITDCIARVADHGGPGTNLKSGVASTGIPMPAGGPEEPTGNLNLKTTLKAANLKPARVTRTRSLPVPVTPSWSFESRPSESPRRPSRFKLQAQFKSTSSKIRPGRSGVASKVQLEAQFKSTTSKMHPGRSGVASIPKEPKARP
jgi:galactosylceramidase